jgi:hypothetical protein
MTGAGKVALSGILTTSRGLGVQSVGKAAFKVVVFLLGFLLAVAGRVTGAVKGCALGVVVSCRTSVGAQTKLA